ncbi:hypothetical protein JWJ90_13325 [Desulfobulbus rhabdoformis]|jgi:tetrahydromethanopterin S-methyltransferase subunit G|uniref:hypothetical protein n=1 Tax=Desulfobulbus rhabdoformis TaxID=34032 RepID=UPI001964F480|nr:hypothetical protein [Desulfobulbus rhabdoformis]MBM9615261.1 hypothetical protein [Desulfobulbus rhabdoformis]
MADLKEAVLLRECILTEIEDAKLKQAQAVERLADVEAIISQVISDPVDIVRKQAGKDTGVVDVLVQGVMVKHNVPKKVEWDEDKLKGIEKTIAAHGDDPSEYMDISTKTTRKVSEKKYKGMSPDVKKVFDSARTVKRGQPKMSFELR